MEVVEGLVRKLVSPLAEEMALMLVDMKDWYSAVKSALQWVDLWVARSVAYSV